MRSSPLRMLLLAAVLAAAGSLAEIPPSLLGGSPAPAPAETARADAAPLPGPARAPSDTDVSRAGATPSSPPAPEPTGAPAADSGGADPGGASRSPLVSRRELRLFADLVLEAASPPALSAAAGAVVPTPNLLRNGLAAPMFATALPGDERIFVLQRSGTIVVLNPDGSLEDPPFLDITSKVATAGEGGLLGMAFAPDHATSRAFYLYYTTGSNPMRSRVARYRVLRANPSQADPASEQILLELDQPASNHNGGTIGFSPLDDDDLYIALGDGGPSDRAQDTSTLLGKMLRIDVSDLDLAGYTVPAGNPFTGDPNVLDEIWSLGFRNPFRWSFDSQTGDLWIGDVGQNAYEEVDYEPAGTPGRNYEWDAKEGDQNYPPTSTVLQVGTPTGPEIVYDHEPGGCGSGSGSVTGGVLYRGPETALDGLYFFADFCQNRVFSYDRATVDLVDSTTEFGSATDGIVAFGEDGFGGLLVVLIDGRIFRVGAGGSECSDGVDNDGDGDADANDLGCRSATDPSERDPEVACDDGIDNDDDGDIDYPDDPNCASAAGFGEISAGGECANGIDDDGDGATDYPDDPGCSSEDDDSELAADIECDDGLDNDDDGDVDYPDDADCTDPADDREAASDGGDGNGGGCGLGFELVVIVPLLARARRRRGRGRRLA